jgi:hypothetical protein
MFASSKAHKAPAAAGGVPFAELTQLNSGTTSYNQAGVLSDGRIVVALTNSGYMGFQIFNTNGSVSGSAYYYTGYANYLYGLAVDSSNNIYLGGSNYVMKCTTSGTVVWTITGFPSGFQNIGMMSCNGTQLAFTSSNRTTAETCM